MQELMNATGPVVVYAHNILDQRKHSIFRGEAGKSLRELQPTVNLPRLCFYNGEIALPEDWDWIPSSEDHVTFLTLPKGGGNASQSIIGIILIIVGYVIPGAQALIWVGAGLLVSGLIPTPSVSAITDSQTAAPSPTYSVQLGGNSARVGQAIPVMYGRHILTPDFASQPYSEYDELGDQYYNALLCLGQLDKFTLESTMIDDTELSHFVDVQTQLVGTQYPAELSLVDPSVVNAPEVANDDLEYGVYCGPFAASGPGLKARYIAIDVICPKGLYLAADDGSMGPKTASWLVESRKITDKGSIAGDWTLLGFESLTDNSNKAIRRSYKYAVDPGRYEVRVSRLEVEDTNARAGHSLQWASMRAYLDIPAPLEPSATFLALRIRANSQLSGLSQRKIAVILRRWLPTWNPDTGWSAPVETTSIAWALADVLKNQAYGGQLPDSRIDLQTLYELDQIWTERGDEFNGVFDKRITVWAALQAIARCGRARPIMRGSVFTFVRDEQQDLPVALFSMRNIKRNSFSIDYTLITEDTADGLELEFFNSDTWASDYVRVPVPGIEESINPATASLIGVSNLDQATREALYTVADSAYRRCAISFVTEMEGYLPAYGSLIAVAHDITGWGFSGDIESYDPATGIALCTEDTTWTVGDHYALLIDEFGDPFGPYKVTAGPKIRTMKFIEVPDPGDIVIYTGTERERTRFTMGPANSYAKLCRVVGITPAVGDTVQIKAVVEDNRVHEADSGFLGGGPTGPGRLARYAPDGLPNYNAATDAQRGSYGYYSTVDRTVGVTEDEGYVYGDG